VLAAGGGSTPRAQEALGVLCEHYWYPLYGYLRGRGCSADAAQDLTQAFFARLLEKNVLSQADPARGRFRSFMLTALKNFAANEHDRKTARKRGGAIELLSLDFQSAEGRYLQEPSSGDTPERVFDRRWALTLLDRALSRLRDEATSRHARQFDQLKVYLTGEQPQPSYAEAAARLDMTEGAVKVAVLRLRRRFRDCVRQEIEQTVLVPEDVEDEIKYLQSAVAR
jgi:RNA polymerase sigma factor (sigma-70 family)